MKKKNFSMMKWARDLFPINRSLTGDGNRKTLNYIKKINKNFVIKNFKSGKKVFDWRVPSEWKITDAYVKDSKGNKVIDYTKHNLHVINYSSPINKKLYLNELKKKLFTIKNKPNSLPYITSYYKKDWGFSIKFNKLKKMSSNQKYKAFIDSKFLNGQMDYGELVINGKSKKTILICSYICHPSMANNELSGPLVVTALSKILKPSKYTIRLLLIPETIGAVSYIFKNKNYLQKNLVAGFNLSCVGDKGDFNLISSKDENTYADLIAQRILSKKKKFKKLSFLKRGSNERQFGCQNLNLPFVTICRTRFGDYKEYHTSDDNLKILSEKNLQETVKLISDIVKEIQDNKIFKKNMICEPFLTKYKLINTTSGFTKTKKIFEDLQNIIAYVGRDNDIKSLSKKLNIDQKRVKNLISIIKKKGIVSEYI